MRRTDSDLDLLCHIMSNRLAFGLYPQPGDLMRTLLLGMICLLLSASYCAAQDDVRLAYIINIDTYETPAGPVKRDTGADTMADVLRSFGFTIQRYDNLTKFELEGVLKEIYADSEGAEAAIVYVSAYALSAGSRNVVLPSDVVSSGADSILVRGVESNDIVSAPRAERLNLIILDAPHDARAALALPKTPALSPFLSAEPPSVPNRLAVYTSSPPTDLYRRLRPVSSAITFARNFKLFLGRKGRTAAAFLRKVAISVFYDSSSQQFPVVVGDLSEPYVLERKNELTDIAAWLEIQARPKAEAFEGFIRQFPNSIYVPFARKRLKELSGR